MIKKPTVSVLMNSYNHAPYVASAMQSVLRQREVDFEFLIADDGSSDETPRVIKSINDSRITFFPHLKNRGACTVTNELIAKASGEFIAKINSDDVWIGDDKLAHQLQIMQDNPSLGACLGRVRFIDKHGNAVEKAGNPHAKAFIQPNRSQGQWLRFFFDNSNCLCQPTMMIRKKCFDHIGVYNNRLRQLPDFDLWVRLIKHYPIYISDREMISFRVLPDENTSAPTRDNNNRCANEHYIIADGFFDQVQSSLLIEGFSDVLRFNEMRSEHHLNIEKTLLYFGQNPTPALQSPYRILGLLKMHKLMNDAHYREILANDFGIDDFWLQSKMAEISTFNPPPQQGIRELLKQKVQRLFD